MSFLTDNSWPAGLVTIFDHARAKHVENRYYGPYDKLLNYCFGSNFTFYVAPQNPPTEKSRETVDFIVFIVVFDQNDRPVLIVEVKDDSWLEKAEYRYRADQQLRDRYRFMLHDCPTPRLWGLSLLGTAMRIYCGHKDASSVAPATILSPEPVDRILPADFLAREWDLDILSSEGFAKIKEIVTDIFNNTGNL
ncbi:hypothetical protein BU17DRAFT_44635 [Hysterangium stoloniferum]|nr:hypothetical protein BU17DRAFT_44635 [Hysterangium stoloniferum]